MARHHTDAGPADEVADPAADVEHEPQRRAAGEPGAAPAASVVAPTGSAEVEAGFLPTRPDRFVPESILVRVIATIGVIAIGTLVGAILVANDVAGWITGLAVASVSVVLAAVLWRSRHL